jgi:hypothetical protein
MMLERAQRALLPNKTASSRSIPAPVGGLNARDALANMPETDAIILDNWFPQPKWVEIRGGKKTLATFTGQCETLAAYSATGGVQLFAAVVNGATRSLYRVDNVGGGAVGAPVVGGAAGTIQAISSTRYDWWQFGTGSAEVLYLLNGTDSPLLFDGTSWYAVTNASSPYAITGANPASFTCVASYHQRLFFLDGTLNAWYLPIDSIAGAVTQLILAPLFQLGGKLVSILSISIDNAAGANDYIAFLSNQGEVIVYQGTDPSQASTWSLSAHFRIGRPIGAGRRCWQKVGSDAALICSDGVILLSEALLTDRSQEKNAVSDKIRHSINQQIQSFGNNFGWQAQLHPFGNKLIINVPTTENQASFAYVMNTLTGAWCTIGQYASSWNAFCFESIGDNLYFGANGAAYQGDVNQDDAGAAIVARVKPAFSYFETPGQLKAWQMARPIFTATGALQVGLTLNVDFDNSAPTGTIGTSQGNSAPWNTSLWTTPTYWGDALVITKNWIGIGGVGYCAAMQLQIAALDVTLQWQSTDYIFQPAGMM